MNSCSSRYFKILRIETWDSPLSGSIFFKAKVPNSSPITAAVLRTKHPLVANSILFLFPVVRIAYNGLSRFVILLLSTLDGTGTLVQLFKRLHFLNISVTVTTPFLLISRNPLWSRFMNIWRQISAFPSDLVTISSKMTSSTSVNCLSSTNFSQNIFLHSIAFFYASS